MQVASVAAVPAAYPSPGAQVFHGAQNFAFVFDENIPAAHAAQVRSVVADGSRVTNWPGAQTVHA